MSAASHTKNYELEEAWSKLLALHSLHCVCHFCLLIALKWLTCNPCQTQKMFPFFVSLEYQFETWYSCVFLLQVKKHTTFGIVGKGKLTQDIILKRVSLEFSQPNQGLSDTERKKSITPNSTAWHPNMTDESANTFKTTQRLIHQALQIGRHVKMCPIRIVKAKKTSTSFCQFYRDSR